MAKGSKVYLLRHVIDSIDEYSSTMPTATTPGKVWRRHIGTSCRVRHVMRNGRMVADYEEDWTLGMYGESYMGEERGKPVALTPIYWFDVEVLEGPAPPGYRPPDWSNYARWRKDRDAERAAVT